VQRGFDGSGTAAQDRGDLGLGQVIDEAEYNGNPLALVEAGQQVEKTLLIGRGRRWHWGLAPDDSRLATLGPQPGQRVADHGPA
jgi:hypothetical protein